MPLCVRAHVCAEPLIGNLTNGVRCDNSRHLFISRKLAFPPSPGRGPAAAAEGRRAGPEEVRLLVRPQSFIDRPARCLPLLAS